MDPPKRELRSPASLLLYIFPAVFVIPLIIG